MDLRIILILATAIAPSPSPGPTADPCSVNGHTALLGVLNRPTIGFSACAVRRGEGVAEGGYQNQWGSPPLASYPQGFIRYGVARNFEADLAPPSRGGAAHTGFGMKWEAAHDARSALGFDLLYTAPAATLNVDYGRALSSVFGFGTTIGVQRTTGYSALLPSAVVTNQFNSRTQLYAEAFGVTRTSVAGGGLFGVDYGVQYLVTPALELDLELGQTTNAGAHANYIGAGTGVRF